MVEAGDAMVAVVAVPVADELVYLRPRSYTVAVDSMVAAVVLVGSMRRRPMAAAAALDVAA